MTLEQNQHGIKLHPGLNRPIEFNVEMDWMEWNGATKITPERTTKELIPLLYERIKDSSKYYDSTWILVGDTLVLLEKMGDKLHVIINKVVSYGVSTGPAFVSPNGDQARLKVLEGGKSLPPSAA